MPPKPKTPAPKTADEKIIAYCVKCRDKRTMVDAKETKTKSGRLMMKGKCEKCGTVMCKFMPNPVPAAPAKK